MPVHIETYETEDSNMYEFGGLTTKGKERGFNIWLNAEFAEELRSLSVPERQEAASENIPELVTDNSHARIRFYGDSFLLSNITVAVQATGLDHMEKKRGRHLYCTHNVDASSEALEVIAIFDKWVELGKHILNDREKNE